MKQLTFGILTLLCIIAAAYINRDVSEPSSYIDGGSVEEELCCVNMDDNLENEDET